jgi:hypothetical protein
MNTLSLFNCGKDKCGPKVYGVRATRGNITSDEVVCLGCKKRAIVESTSDGEYLLKVRQPK